MIAALFVDPLGTYAGLPDVELWDAARDARTYAGPHPVVAHPPCERWGRFYHGSPSRPHQFKAGADQGCFAAALWAVRTFGGVLEHPANSRAWDFYGLAKPRNDRWTMADNQGGFTAELEQGNYGHLSRKPTWLYVHSVDLVHFADLVWGRAEQRLDPVTVERHGYEKARRRGVLGTLDANDKRRIATPVAFRDLLLSIARTARP